MTKTLKELFTSYYSKLPKRTLLPGECQTNEKQQCSLCFARPYHYKDEIVKKNLAVKEFWNSLDQSIHCEDIIASPKDRYYRNVSKRKAFLNYEIFSLGLIGVDEDSAKSFPMSIIECAIEPKEHSAIYDHLQQYLRKPANKDFAAQFNYVIVKGSEKEFTVIFNLNEFSSTNRRDVNSISKYISGKVKGIVGVFVFVDENRSRYYLSDRPKNNSDVNQRPLQKIFGESKIFHSVNGIKYFYSPLSFSQTNHSILPSFIQETLNLLDVKKNDIVYDLYCGYGLFSLHLAKHAEKVTAVELSHDSIRNAIDNAKLNKISNTHFLASNISESTLPRFVKHTGEHLKILLDPPRSGTTEGVIERIATFNPQKVVHIFCNSEIIQSELLRWERSGYIPAKVQPIDMFPGTSDVEMMVLLEKISTSK